MKNNRRKITLAEMVPHIHSFAVNENKVDKLTAWLRSWIKASLESGKISEYDLLPTKAEFAYHICVSQGTMQNVFRNLENEGIVESKQRIGTYIKPKNAKQKSEKLTSKRELIVEDLKKYIKSFCELGEKIPSTRTLAKELNSTSATVRMAISCLIFSKVLIKKENSFYVLNKDFKTEDIKHKTLVDKVAKNIELYVKQNLKENEKLPANKELSKIFNVSTKTIHDSIKLLSKKGLLYTRRGQYGTIVMAKNDESPESYHYERIEQKIRNYIIEKCEINEKLPSIRAFAKEFNSSEKTVKRALDNLAEEGYLMFARGRYGGTFVVDIPQNANEAYKWLAITSDYVSNMEN